MNPLFFTYPLSAVLIFVLSLGVGIFLTRRFGLNWRLYWIGGLTFVGSQVLHIPFNSYLLAPLINNGTLLFNTNGLASLVVAAFWYGLSSGLFEEIARYLVFSRWIKNDRTWARALLFGAGHGGMEAMIIGFLVLMTYFQLFAFVGRDPQTLAPNSSAQELALLQQQISQYWSAPWLMSLMGFLERLFTIPMHIANAVLVVQVFRRGQMRWLWFAVAWHAFLNASVLVVANQLKGFGWGAYATEGYLGVLALFSLYFIWALRSPEPAPAVSEAQPAAPTASSLPFKIEPIDDSGENLDQTRFN